MVKYYKRRRSFPRKRLYRRKKTYFKKRFYKRRRHYKRGRGRTAKTTKQMGIWRTPGPFNVQLPLANSYSLTSLVFKLTDVVAGIQDITGFRAAAEEWKLTKVVFYLKAGLISGNPQIHQTVDVIDSTPGAGAKVVTDEPNQPLFWWRLTANTNYNITDSMNYANLFNHKGLHWIPIRNNFTKRIRIPLRGRYCTETTTTGNYDWAPSTKRMDYGNWWGPTSSDSCPTLWGIQYGIFNPGPDDWRTMYRLSGQFFYHISFRRVVSGITPWRNVVLNRNTTIALKAPEPETIEIPIPVGVTWPADAEGPSSAMPEEEPEPEEPAEDEF